MTTNKLGDRLKASRLKQGLTLEELGRMVGTSKETVQQIESGKTKNPRCLPDLAKALNISPAWLQFGVAEIDQLSKEDMEIALRLPELSPEKKKVLLATLTALLKE